MSYTSEVEIWNLALIRMGHKPVASPDERSNERRLCNVLYPQARDLLLREFDWSFARETKDLAALGEEELTDGWRFAYQWPQDAIAFRRIVDPLLIPTLGTTSWWHAQSHGLVPPYEFSFPSDGLPVPFELMRTVDRSAMKIMSDLEDAKGRYTLHELDPGFYDPQFGEAVSWELQAGLTRSISKSDRKEQIARGLSQIAVSVAEAATANEFAPRRKAKPRTIAARG